MRGWLALALILASGGCNHALSPDLPARLGDIATTAPTPIPTTEVAFLAELSPLPSAGVLVVYDINGPGGLAGTLEVMLAEGGRRRENWSLAVEVEGQPVAFEGWTVQTPAGIATQGPAGRSVEPLPLGALAQAYVAADESTKTRAIESLRHLHRRVATASLGDDRPTETIAGVQCQVTRLASQDLCLWEAAGLPLRYDGDAFELRAIRIELDPELGDRAFAIDDLPAPDGAFDAEAALEALANGSYGELGPWLHPGLRLPGSGLSA